MNKKKALLLPMMVLAAGVLAACSTSTVVARPGWQDQKIIDGLDVKDNQMKVIYDAVKALGDTNANVLNKVLYDISVKNVGDYYDDDKGLGYFIDKTFDQVDKEKLKEFIKDRPNYKTTEKYLIDKDGNKTELKENETDYLKVSFQMIQNQLAEIKENIAEKLYDEIKGGTYSIDNVFHEEKFLMSLRKNMYDVPSLSEMQSSPISLKSGVLLPRGYQKDEPSEKVSWYDYIGNFINIGGRMTFGSDKNERLIYGDYIKQKIIPDIYRAYLIQTYVKEQRYANISRSYARKVKTISIPRGEYVGEVGKLVSKFAKDHIVGTDANFNNFDLLENAMRGFVGDKNSDEYKALSSAGFPLIKDSENNTLNWKIKDTESTTMTNTYVFKGTKLGDLIEKLQKVYTLTNNDGSVIMTLRKDADESAYKDLTNSGAYRIEDGLILKEREAHTTTFTKDGWFLKNGGLTDLNSKIRERLFNIQTGNIIDSGDKSYKEGNYVIYFHDKAFLTGEYVGESQDENSIVIDDNTNYNIIYIEEAIKTSKMADSSNADSYMHKKATSDKFASINAMNKIVYDVVKTNAAGDTYKKNANQYYLMISNILFYDQSVYDYFKSQYPDLFK